MSSTNKQDEEPFYALMIGAGFAMFGSPEGPWNIARRLHARVGSRLSVQAVIEVDPPRAEAALKIKLASPAEKAAYEGTVILPTIEAFAERVKSGQSKEPKAVFVATPPLYRGGTSSGRDLEVKLHKHFPNAGIFVEKPIATGVPWEESVAQAQEVGKLMKQHNGVVSVGYVLRYLDAVKQMKKIIEDNNLTVMATVARYVVAYELAIKSDWWNKSIIQGPIVEQATHICDLSRYFGGEIDIDTLTAHAVEAHEKPGELSKKNFDESVIPDDQRIPRATIASWKYENGAVGTMLHAIALHGVDYSIELQVFADGYQLILSDPYGIPALHVRRPGSDKSEIIPTPGDDPYQTEMDHFIDTVSSYFPANPIRLIVLESLKVSICVLRLMKQIESGPNPVILSTYEDAARTYEMTWQIRTRSEEVTRKKLERQGKA
ncbi:putative oxidoreductase C terminal-domain-containing protein [Naematelia encephala]|uniref:Putative oxidoreductase C terminal-domain-containing protein n=1 Tax=Naematelia encephala TaxID=71784 RepID=A0A1Y2BBT5_9TREE|nr:putative oxidoreductase C terminal-domain-containing protein [Naematelia encephala]